MNAPDLSTAPALAVEGLGYSFGARAAVTGITFQVDTGTIHGFVGPNGAGKTTTLKIVATLLAPQRGKVKVFGEDVTEKMFKVRRNLGYMPDHLGMYRQMTVFEYLDFFAAAYGQPVEKRDATITDVLQLTDMHKRKDDLLGSLSRGMEQRVSLARVLVHDPKLLLLDEPASGLDPRARIELMEILRELCRIGKTILISSHILAELANLCHAVTIIDRGTVKYTGAMQRLLELGGEYASWRIQLRQPVPAVRDALQALAGVREASVEEDAVVVVVEPQVVGTQTILETVFTAGGEVVGFQPSRRQLDEAFLALTEPGVRE